MTVIRNTFLFSELDNEIDIIDLVSGDSFDFSQVVRHSWTVCSAQLSALCCLLYFVQILNWIRVHNSNFQFKQGGSN